MCGILCSINYSINKEEFFSSLNLMEHRGPDSDGYKLIDNIQMGHKRLSIIDINDRSNQPFSFKNFHMIYNGEVYNYKELIIDHRLEVKTSSDTEVVMLMYIKYGIHCLKYFNGMFSFVIYNDITKDTFIARDRLGIKPLYYKNEGTKWIFSSEIAPIINLKNAEFCGFGIRQYKKLRMTVGGHTIYKNIYYFPPGHYWLNGKIYRYWDLEIEDREPPSDEELEWLIKDSIRLRRRSDVPVGSYLSGGLDSTILTYLLKPDHTWTVGFNEMNEFDWGRIAASLLVAVLFF